MLGGASGALGECDTCREAHLIWLIAQASVVENTKLADFHEEPNMERREVSFRARQSVTEEPFVILVRWGSKDASKRGNERRLRLEVFDKVQVESILVVVSGDGKRSRVGDHSVFVIQV